MTECLFVNDFLASFQQKSSPKSATLLIHVNNNIYCFRHPGQKLCEIYDKVQKITNAFGSSFWDTLSQYLPEFILFDIPGKLT